MPAKRPHDRNFVSKFNSSPSVVSTEVNHRDFILVTSVSYRFVDRLENLIGSIHYYEPYLSIIVFDLGMTDLQLSRISCMANIQIEIFPFEIYPHHVTDLQLYAYKALILKEALTKYRSKTKAIFYLDAGTELRSSLDPIVEAIKTRGYFLTRQKTLIIDHTDEQTFAALNVSKSDFSTGNHYQTAAGILGFSTNHSGFYKDILISFVECSLKIDCIAPSTSISSTKHRFDQSVLSILVYKAGYTIENEERFYGDFRSAPELDASMVIFSRRWHCPKLYTSEIIFRQICHHSSILRSRYHIRNVHEQVNAHACGKLSIIKVGSFQIELPVYQVYELIFICYVLLMSYFYCSTLYVLKPLVSVAMIKQRV